MQLLIDADIVVFRYACVLEYDIDWGDGTKSTVQEIERIPFEVDNFIEMLVKRTKCEDYLLCFTDQLNFRYKVLPTYKHNRKDKVLPGLFHDIRKHMKDNHPWKSKPWLEADDVMGVLSTLHPEECIIATLDKDLIQIPGWHYNWRKDKLFKQSLEDADRWFYRQILTGDSVDGFKGIPGVGPKRAEIILDSYDREAWWLGSVLEYEHKGLTEDDALQQARVARICRAEDYNFKKQEVILWQP